MISHAHRMKSPGGGEARLAPADPCPPESSQTPGWVVGALSATAVDKAASGSGPSVSTSLFLTHSPTPFR